MKRIGRRIVIAFTAAFAAVILCGGTFIAAAQETDNSVRYIAPELPAGAQAYDAEHPEILLAEQLYAKSAILIEASSGTVIFEKNADNIMYPASTTKILTIFLGIVKGDMESTVTASSVSVDLPENSSSIPLELGETINFRDLLFATFVRSGNDGARLIAESVADSIPDFINAMNQAAAMIGCTSTHFANPSGLDDLDHYTTAHDMALIAQEAMKNELFRNIAKSFTYSLPRSNIRGSRVLVGTGSNWLNGAEDNEYYYPDAIGIKTGYLDRAGYCFVGAAERDGVELISVVFYSSWAGRWTDTIKLMEYGFTQFVSVTPMQLYKMNPTTIATSGYSLDDTDIGRLELGIRARTDTRPIEIVTTITEVENMARNLRENVLIEYTRETFAAPVTAGEVFGTMTYYPDDGGAEAVYDLYATRSIVRRENAPRTIAEIREATYADPNPLPPFSLEALFLLGWPFLVLIAVILVLRRVFIKKSKRGRKNNIPKPKTRYFR
ncbi:MAG: D-alanyl-D-alanine carboxypeptidase [Clostridiales bacterium]|nr:D-alanyl-D-alanine carboxypeptidase [Clostridiales bacterium]